MEKGILTTLRYFAQFSYAPRLRELHMFHPTRVSALKHRDSVEKMTKNKQILWTTEADGERRYTLGGYSIFLNKTLKKAANSRYKLHGIRGYLEHIEKLQSVAMIGISGSVAVENADSAADVDLFIVSRAGRMWTARALTGPAAAVLGIRRGRLATRASGKVCLNMFMDETDLTVPKAKQTVFVAHEILQMRPVFDRGATYYRFLKANEWVYRFFPNAKTARTAHFTPGVKWGVSTGSFFESLVESFAKRLQLILINRHKTTEIITDTQLWFFPDDYERKVKV